MQQATQQLIVGNNNLIDYVLISNRPWFLADGLLGFTGHDIICDEMIKKVKHYNRITYQTPPPSSEHVTLVNVKGFFKLLNDSIKIEDSIKIKVIEDVKRFCFDLATIEEHEKEHDAKIMEDMEIKIKFLETRLKTEIREVNEKNEKIKQMGLEIDILTSNNEILEDENKTIEIKNEEIKQLQIEIQILEEEMEDTVDSRLDELQCKNEENLNHILEEYRFENEYQIHRMNKLKRKNEEELENVKKMYRQKLATIKNICIENIEDL